MLLPTIVTFPHYNLPSCSSDNVFNVWHSNPVHHNWMFHKFQHQVADGNERSRLLPPWTRWRILLVLPWKCFISDPVTDMTKTVQPLVYHINIYYLEEWVNKVEKMYRSFSLVVVSHNYFFEHVKTYFVQCPNFRVPNNKVNSLGGVLNIGTT